MRYSGSFLDVGGLILGHAANAEGMTGVSVAIAPNGAVAGVDVRGAAPGTRETDLLNPSNMVERIHAVALCGGSAYGLDAAGGVMRYLEETGIGLSVGPAIVPIVCAAVIFDLLVGTPGIRPDAQMGYQAAQSATQNENRQGNIGAGTGATVAKMLPGAMPAKGGIGMASLPLPGGGTVSALICINALGDIVDPKTNEGIACASIGGQKVRAIDAIEQSITAPFGNTTIGIIATDVALSKAQANRLASVAHDGLALSIRPAHTMHDGDTLFALSTGDKPCDSVILHTMAVEVVWRAVVNAALCAREQP